MPVWTAAASTIQVALSNGLNCGQVPRRVNLVFHCDLTAKIPTYEIYETTTCVYTLTMETEVACPSYVPKPKPTGGSKLSGGWIFIIILVVCTFVYIVVGCIFQRKMRGTTTMRDSFPHIVYWQQLGSLVKDGSTFVLAKLRSLTRGGAGGGSYQTIK